MSTPDSISDLAAALAQFYDTLDAVTVPTSDGGRRIDGTAHAIALSEATATLYHGIAAAQKQITRTHGVAAKLPAGASLMESDSPDGPFTPLPPEQMSVRIVKIGGAGAAAMLVAALDSASKVAVFPNQKWNAMQAHRPGGDHQRWHAGEVVSAAHLATLESAKKSLGLYQASRQTDETPPAAKTKGVVSNGDDRVATLYEQAIQENAALSTDKEVWGHLTEQHDRADLPVSLNAFKQALKRCRTAKRLPRKREANSIDRATGKSVIRHDQK